MDSMRKMKKHSKPKLQRLNAVKNIDYQLPTSRSSSTSSSIDLTSSLDRQTSFRVMGIDGEFERIFQSLGLSGPEDFAIPTDAWEARKARSAASPKLVTGVVQNSDSDLKNGNFEGEDSKGVVSSGSKVLGCGNRDGIGGIKGVRPPLLAPPPAILGTIVDGVSSSWNLMRSLAPQVDDGVVGVGVVNSPSSSGECRVVDGGGVLCGVRHGERSVLFTDSGSFTTSHDDDSDVGGERASSGVVDEGVHGVSPNGSFRRTFSSWQKGDILGKGSFGTVYEGLTDDGFFFAVKEVSLLDEGTHGKHSIFQLQQEISLLSQFQHENIVRYFGTDKNQSTLYIFLELVPKGSLQSLYQKYRLNDSQVSSYTRQILSGLKYLHDREVVHRDIKCANILVDVSGSVKLADFGLAKATKLNDVKSSKGSPYWMAPEVVNLRNHGYGLAADIWSLGCTVLEMLTRQPPYSDLEGMQALFRIGRGEPPPVPESLSKDARDFIHKCLQVNPSKRPSAAQLLDHPFLKRSFISPLSPASPLTNIFRF